MANPEITNYDNGAIFIGTPKVESDVLNLAGADEIAEGTILARHNGNGKLILFVKGGSTNENGIPKAILTHHVSAAGSGDQSVRVAVEAVAVKHRLIIDADGDDSNIDAAVKDQLRDYGLTVREVSKHSVLDNQ